MSLIFGIGEGLFSLGIIWVVGLLLALLLARLGNKAAVFGLVLLLFVFSLVMILYPRKGEPRIYICLVDFHFILGAKKMFNMSPLLGSEYGWI